MSHPISINEIALAMVSSNIACRKLVIDMLTFLAYWNDHQGHQYVLRALDSLMNAKGEKARFDAWFTILEATIDGRGKMGSLVGASDEVRTLRSREALQQSQSNATTASGGSILNEYTVGIFSPSRYSSSYPVLPACKFMASQRNLAPSPRLSGPSTLAATNGACWSRKNLGKDADIQASTD